VAEFVDERLKTAAGHMESQRIPTALLVLRITVFVVMFVWTILFDNIFK
jgi:hypothetical protein